MTPDTARDSDLVVSSNFIRAIRESGYLNLSTALAELIDNSLQAEASEVAITVRRESADSLPEITVEDNGTGMSEDELGVCLRFGGSSRFDARESFGRFGMGLPAASLSQARRVEVTAWRDGGCGSTVVLDVDAVVAGVDPAPEAVGGTRSKGRSGCRVRWAQCDRIEYRRLAWLERSLHKDLGRMYRRFLATGLTMTINGSRVAPVDPTLLSTQVEGHTAQLAFDELHYQMDALEGGTSTVTVRFVVLPVQHWHSLDNVTKRRIGIVGGSGVSILRSGREIAHGWYLMGGKRKENYDDWWRCEIEFDPSLDEHFGITVNKQGIRPSALLREAIEPELESIARLLNARIRQAFEEVKFQTAAEASCRIASAADPDLPVIASSPERNGPIRYRLEAETLPLETMFLWEFVEGTLKLTLNTDHPAFPALYQRGQVKDEKKMEELQTSMELLLLAFARSAVQSERADEPMTDLIRAWSGTYGQMLNKS